MKRAISLLLAILFMLPLSPALAAERGESARPEAAFADVPAGAWYARGVETCVQAGLMAGTGDGNFSPQLPLSQSECLVLALRLYDLNHGGDGRFPAAPDDWTLGSFTLTTADGTALTADVSDPQSVSFQPTGIIFYLSPEQKAWAKAQAGTTAALRYGDGVYSAVLEAPDFEGPPCLVFPVAYGTPFYPVYDALTQQRGSIPSPKAWYRDAWYYRTMHNLEDRFPFSYEDAPSASREQFALSLVEAGAQLTAINQITLLPDTADQQILSLYNAGILTGTDAYGRFSGDSGLTRADAAVMLARMCDPAQRQRFTPAALPPAGQGYTLTYLLDGIPSPPTYPVCAVDASSGESGLLTLDGRLLPWPGRVSSFGLYGDGEYLHLDVQSEDIWPWESKAVLMDRNGNFVAPLGEYDQMHATADGRFVAVRGQYTPTSSATSWFLLNSDGSAAQTLPAPDQKLGDTTWEGAWWDLSEGLCPREDPASGLYGYVDTTGAWVLAPTWTSAAPFRDGRAVVAQHGLSGVIDHTGSLLVPCAYASLYGMGNGQYYCWDWETLTYSTLYPGGSAVRTYLDPGTALGGRNGYFPCAWNSLPGETDTYCYLDETFKPITPAEFTFAGAIGPDGSGFVGKDGKIYRIQFDR